LACYKRVIELKPDYAEAWYNRGVTLGDFKRHEEALASYDRAIELKPDYAAAWSNRGVALNDLKRHEEALASYKRAIELKPDYAEAWSNRGNALNDLWRHEEALASYDRAIVLKPEYAEAWSNRGNALNDLRRHEEALASYDRAIELQPDYAVANWNKSLDLLRLGDFERGWKLYEWRWRLDNLTSPQRHFTPPLWLGEVPLEGKTILIHAEQGLGDTIKFCRYIKLVQQLGSEVIFEVQAPLASLLSQLDGVARLIPRGTALPAFDYQCPLLSLPLAFKTNLVSIPASIPYLSAEADRVKQWKDHLGDHGYKIGICWQGTQKDRSVSITFFQALSQIPNVRLVSLLKGDGERDLDSLPDGMRIETLGSGFDSSGAFLDTAAVMKCCDLVITIDTSVAHLAGALGVRTWVALKFIPDWRWMLDRSDSPWYPTMRLFRQKQRDEWQSVFDEMSLTLRSELNQC
ncbi:MAG: tetratricopeptide repeat protein, partial [Betaproteobacteria bacterium]|nr:tetratricopeptide repeat protein [Betaproteobacteria bacterium]